MVAPNGCSLRLMPEMVVAVSSISVADREVTE